MCIGAWDLLSAHTRHGGCRTPLHPSSCEQRTQHQRPSSLVAKKILRRSGRAVMTDGAGRLSVIFCDGMMGAVCCKGAG
eukprot:800809-Rhodomonas_salina.3